MFSDMNIDLEILTELQHYGGKTNLIDFTTDYFIAIFFACDGHSNENGRVILLRRTNEIEDIIMRPQNPRHRVIAQKSVFIRPPEGFIEPREEETVTIPACLKQPLLEYLRKYHDVSTETIYNDLHGFIRSQDIHVSSYTHFYRGFACQNRAKETADAEVKKQKYENAIKCYSEAIKSKPDFTVAYNNRGIVYKEKGEFQKAIEDYTIAINLDPDYANAYNNRGNAYKEKGEFQKAIEDYTIAINLDPDYANAYNNRGNAYTDAGDFDNAMKDFNTAIKLNPDDAGAYNNRGAAYAGKKSLIML